MLPKDEFHHPVLNDLVRAELCSAESFTLYHSGTRDRSDLDVFECQKCGVLVLSSCDHATIDYYEEKDHPELRSAETRERVARRHLVDTRRRVRMLTPHVADRDWLDVGTGAGGLLDEVARTSRSSSAVEPQAEFRESLRSCGFEVYRSVDELPPEMSFDIITAFHVIEHVPNAIDFLSALRVRLRDHGLLVVEVPHARDILISLLRPRPFLDHTFWSEHLLLHTRLSLERFLRLAGFTDVEVRGVQRYPLANHLYWLGRGCPNGQLVWPFLSNPVLDQEYEGALARIDATDTLVAYARASN